MEKPTPTPTPHDDATQRYITTLETGLIMEHGRATRHMARCIGLQAALALALEDFENSLFEGIDEKMRGEALARALKHLTD